MEKSETIQGNLKEKEKNTKHLFICLKPPFIVKQTFFHRKMLIKLFREKNK